METGQVIGEKYVVTKTEQVYFNNVKIKEEVQRLTIANEMLNNDINHLVAERDANLAKITEYTNILKQLPAIKPIGEGTIK